LVKELMNDLRAEGTTIIMSTHMMHQVEELCDRILLINKGRNVIYGPLNEIRRSYAGHAVHVRVDGPLPQLNGILAVEQHNSVTKLTLDSDTSPQDVLVQLVGNHVNIEQFEIATPTLDEIFIRAVKEDVAPVEVGNV
jgi:ABC-2 type transport system ATP-binding protein